jgi:phosphopantetheinyl transferase
MMIFCCLGLTSPSFPHDTLVILGQSFNQGEVKEYLKFRVPKRKREWLASRWLVKYLVAKVNAQNGNHPLNTISIQKMDSGVPAAVIEGVGKVGWLSMSHSRDAVLVGYSSDAACRFGVDLEAIEPRSAEMLEDFFTPAEIQWVSSSPDNKPELRANLVWSAKEAYLKAIEQGLRVDTRKIEIKPLPVQELFNGWERLGFSANDLNVLDWSLWFKQVPDYVLTLCLPATSTPPDLDVVSIS